MAEAAIIAQLATPENIAAVVPFATATTKTAGKTIAIVLGVVFGAIVLIIIALVAAGGKKGKQKTAKRTAEINSGTAKNKNTKSTK